jgi:hypothetical protein
MRGPEHKKGYNGVGFYQEEDLFLIHSFSF